MAFIKTWSRFKSTLKKGVYIMQTEAKGIETQTYWQAIYDVPGKLSVCYKTITKEGEPQKVFLAGTRSVIGIASVYLAPGAAIAGASIGVTMPTATRYYCELADGALTGVWNRMSLEAKLVAATCGIGCLAWGVNLSVLTIPCAIFSSKIGAELGVQNYSKQLQDK